MINEIQLEIFNKIKLTVCDTVQYNEVGKNAIEVVTPFLDWKGAQVSIFITEDGRITDGGQILSQLKSLRVIDNFNNWEFKLDFFQRSRIQKVRGSLQPIDNESVTDILKYVQGITRLPNFFEPKPIHATSDKFPNIARDVALNALIDIAPHDDFDKREQWAAKFIKARHIPLNGFDIESDMSPNKYCRLVKIISHATSNTSDRRQHVSAKVLDSLLWKRDEPDVELYIVVDDVDVYPPESGNLLREESEEIIQLKFDQSGARLAEVLTE